jgi:hypothetical protein
MPLALVIAAADLLVAASLWRGSRRASRPEPARLTALTLLVCAAILIALHATRHWGNSPHPTPHPNPQPHPPATGSTVTAA